MSTPNFASPNASRFFVYATPYHITQEDIDANGWEQDCLGQYDADFTRIQAEDAELNVTSELKKKGWHEIQEYSRDRNFPSTFFAEKTEEIYCGDTTVEITIQAGGTSGYYDADNFDWFVGIKVQGYIEGWHETFEYESDELEADDVIRDNWFDNKGLSKIHASRVIRKIEAVIDRLKNEAELAFSKYCDEEMYCEWIAGNGEAAYSRTRRRLWQEMEQPDKKTA